MLFFIITYNFQFIGYIRMDLEEMDINARNWVDTAQGRDY